METAKPYDIVVAKDGSGDFTSINAAIETVPENAGRKTIFVKKGVYEEKVFIGNRWKITTVTPSPTRVERVRL